MTEYLVPSSEGGPEFVQLLTPEGVRVDHPEYAFDGGADEAATVRGFYRDMVLTRRIDTESTALQRHGELGIWAQLLGQEAAQIGGTQRSNVGKARRPAIVACQELQELARVALVGLDRLGRQPPFLLQRREPVLARLLKVWSGRNEEFLHWHEAPGWNKSVLTERG